MANLQTLESALRRAHEAGDTDAAKVFASEIKKMRSAQPPVPQAPTPDWADVPGLAASNFGSSAAKFGGDIAHMVTSPIETGESIYNLALGAAQKLIPDSWTDGPMGKEKYADAMGEFFSKRYGGEDEIKRTLATDPVGVLADFSAFLTGGATAVAKMPMIAGKAAQLAKNIPGAAAVGNVAGRVPGVAAAAEGVGRGAATVGSGVVRGAEGVGTVGKWMDPLYSTVRGAGAIAKTKPMAAALTMASQIPESLVGAMTGTGAAPIREAFDSGRRGGESGKAFRENMRGAVDYERVVADAKSGLEQIRSDRGQHYRSGMVDISKDKTVLDFSQVDNALVEAVANNTFKGVAKSKPTELALKNIKELIEEWKGYDAVEFHTPEGMDALKQKIGSLVDWTSNPKAQNLAAQAMYDKVGSLIREQAPTYDKVMGDYSKTTLLIKEIEKSLSLGKKATADSALRKLSSVMRNNLNTNYGARLASLERLQTASGKPLMSSIAGQSMSAKMPRGLAGTGLQSMIPIGAAFATGNLAPLAALPLQSPRLVGEAAHLGGRVGGGASQVSSMANSLLGRTGATPRGIMASGYQANRAKEQERMKRALGAR
jgi:hypothetical protein|tara:strand:+ start:1595 stop:3394 length:1800 start_codon:yes stop_codon:yes gene_type:complete